MRERERGGGEVEKKGLKRRESVRAKKRDR